jgi:hypothetical protein
VQPGEEQRLTDVDATLYDLLEQQVVPIYYKRDARGLPHRVAAEDEARAAAWPGSTSPPGACSRTTSTRYYAPAMRGGTMPIG